MEKWEKCAIRTAKKQARKAIGQEQRALWNSQIVHNIVENPTYQNAKILMSYCAMGGEVDLQALHQLAYEQGKRVAFPYCTSGTEMIALEPLGLESWEKGRYGIWAPIPSRSHVIPPDQLELVLCPCTAFDRQGHRLAWAAATMTGFCPAVRGLSSLLWPMSCSGWTSWRQSLGMWRWMRSLRKWNCRRMRKNLDRHWRFVLS